MNDIAVAILVAGVFIGWEIRDLVNEILKNKEDKEDKE